MIDMLNIYVCDDNVAFIEIVTAAITRILNNICGFQISTFDNGEDLLEECNNRCPDVVFLDIDMPFIDGFKVAEMLQKHQINTLIVFVTSHEDKVYQSWTYQPFWFVRKSHLGDLEIVISKLLSRINMERKKKKLFCKLKSNNSVIEIDINALTVIEAVRHDLLIKYRDGTSFKIRCKVSDAEKQLENLNIVRVQNGVLVNCRYISKVTSREVILLDESKINLSRQRIELVQSEFIKYMRNI